MNANFILLYVLIFFVTSCRQAKKDVPDIAIGGIKPIVSEAKGWPVPADSSPVFTTYPAYNTSIIKAGNPTITAAFANINPAGKPIIIKAGNPEILSTANTKEVLQQTTPAEIKKIPCLNKHLVKASSRV